MRFLLLTALLCALAAPQGRAEDITPHLRDNVEDSLASTLIFPETANWRFDPIKPYMSGQKLVCGWVNYQSGERKYVGEHRFYAILDGETVVRSQINDPAADTAGDLANKIKLLCGSI